MPPKGEGRKKGSFCPEKGYRGCSKGEKGSPGDSVSLKRRGEDEGNTKGKKRQGKEDQRFHHEEKRRTAPDGTENREKKKKKEGRFSSSIGCWREGPRRNPMGKRKFHPPSGINGGREAGV